MVGCGGESVDETVDEATTVLRVVKVEPREVAADVDVSVVGRTGGLVVVVGSTKGDVVVENPGSLEKTICGLSGEFTTIAA